MEDFLLNYLKPNGVWIFITIIFLAYLKEFIASLAKKHSDAIIEKTSIAMPIIIKNSKSFFKKYSFAFFIIFWVLLLQFVLFWKLDGIFSQSQVSAILGVFMVFLVFIVGLFAIFYFYFIIKDRDILLELVLYLYKENANAIMQAQKATNENLENLKKSLQEF